MKRIRKIALLNQAGERWSLNGGQGVYAMSLSGLGVTLAPSFADLSRGFFTPVSDEAEPQNTIPFTLVFTQNPYVVYQRLMDWLAAAGTITIVYDPIGAQEYFRDVSVNFLQKGELTEVGWMEVPCSFFCTTPWYLPAPDTIQMRATGTDESKRYNYAYTSDLKYGTDSSASMSGTVVGSGHIPGSLEMRFHGAIVNPKIRLTGDISGKTFGLCSLTAVLGATDTLWLSTRYEASFVRKIAAGGAETDLLDALDLSTIPFFHIPVDEPCTLTVEADQAFSGHAELLVYYYYRSV